MPRISTLPSSAAHDRHSASSPPELPPASATPPSSRGISWLLTALISSIVAAIAITLIGVWVFPAVLRHLHLLQPVRNKLPLLKRLTTGFYPTISLAPVLVVLIRLLWPSKAGRAIAAGVFGLLMLFGGVPLVFLSAYLPIFQLSSTL